MTELEEIRNRLGWSQSEMGERIGMHRNSVANAERKQEEDKTTSLAARMVALDEAARRGDLSTLSKQDRALVLRLVGIALGEEMAPGSSVPVGPQPFKSRLKVKR